MENKNIIRNIRRGKKLYTELGRVRVKVGQKIKNKRETIK